MIYDKLMALIAAMRRKAIDTPARYLIEIDCYSGAIDTDGFRDMFQDHMLNFAELKGDLDSLELEIHRLIAARSGK